MWFTLGSEADDGLMRRQVLAFLDEYCRGMTLQDACEWYADAFAADDRPVAILAHDTP